MADLRTIIYRAAYAGVRIDLANIRTSKGNDLVPYAPPRGDGAELDNRGRRLRISTCEVLFWETEQEADERIRGLLGTNHLERYRAFEQLCHDGQAHTLVHPFEGSFTARVSDFEVSGDDSSMIAVRCTFEEDRARERIFAGGAGTRPPAGVASVRAAADEVQGWLDDLGLDSDIPDKANALMDSWDDIDITSRQVNLELASFSAELGDEATDLELAMDVDRWPLTRALVQLHALVRQVAASKVEIQRRLIELTLEVPQPARIVAAELYGAQDAEARTTELVELNDLRNPGLIPAGTVLKAYAPAAS